MTSFKTILALAASAAVLSTANVGHAQTQYGQSQPTGQTQSSGQAVLGQILQGLLGGQSTGTVESEWNMGRRALGARQATFDSRLDAEVRSGSLQTYTANRIRTDYNDLVQLEARYALDGRFVPQEREDLTNRYNGLIAAIEQGSYDNPMDGYQSVADGRVEFDRRVTTALASRRLTRTDATRLRTDYAALQRLEADYQRNGLDARERQDIEARLDALDLRVGDMGGLNGGNTYQQSPATRIAALQRALPQNRGVPVARLRVQLEDLARLDVAYTRTSASAEDRAYLNRRIGEVENEARLLR